MSEINFTSLGKNWGVFEKREEEAKTSADESSQKPVVSESQTKQVAAETMLDALSAVGRQNLAGIKNNLLVNPADYLSDEQISSIEESMKLFEDGVNDYADEIKAEFGSILSEQAVYSLAANAYAAHA